MDNSSRCIEGRMEKIDTCIDVETMLRLCTDAGDEGLIDQDDYDSRGDSNDPLFFFSRRSS